jgi:hypothetical protein
VQWLLPQRGNKWILKTTRRTMNWDWVL